jgi:hypothetical protein
MSMDDCKCLIEIPYKNLISPKKKKKKLKEKQISKNIKPLKEFLD